MRDLGTFYFDTDGSRLGSDDFLLPITLYKGMKITIHSYDESFEVVEWSYHKGHPDEEAGLKIVLKRNTDPEGRELLRRALGGD